jgi:hypothetical protein
VAPAIFANVAALGLEKFGEPVQVELSQPPHKGTHTLVTDLEPQGGYAGPNPHLSTAVDTWTPLAPDGTPALSEAWRYLLGSRGVNEANDGDENDDAVEIGEPTIQEDNQRSATSSVPPGTRAKRT